MADKIANWIFASKSKCSNAPAPPICGTETGALHQGKAIHFQIRSMSLFGLTAMSWIMNEKVRSRFQATEMGFLRKISSLTLLDKVKRADICESPLFRLERANSVGMDT